MAGAPYLPCSSIPPGLLACLTLHQHCIAERGAVAFKSLNERFGAICRAQASGPTRCC